MKKSAILTVEVDNQGRFILPVDISKRYGFTAGAIVRIEEGATGLKISRTSDNLARVYVEPTNQCNLDCVTCMRNVWNEPPGWMSDVIFQRILEGILDFKPVPSIFFGGYGEPLTHPSIYKWIKQAHEAGAVVELITNGILLSEQMSQRLISAGLNRVWVSLDGATPESFADVRLGAALPDVIANLRRLKELRNLMNSSIPRLGIAFVAMKRNFGDLPEIVHLGKSLGADQFSISNVLPHTPELRDEMLYQRSFYKYDLDASEVSPMLALPRLDINATTGDSLIKILDERHLLSITRQELNLGLGTCPFVEKGSLSIRWDGNISPCLALLHDHESYLDNHVRKSKSFSVGSLADHSLVEIWQSPEYKALRERLAYFDFSPCTFCNSCDMADANLEDCFGNTLPACGGCLWAQGFIQCP